MNPRLKKEFRPLLLPWSTALFGAVLMMALGHDTDTAQLESFLAAIGCYAFLGGLALVGSTVFGTELQYRTFPLLLSQPSDRARIWFEKMLVSGLAILSAALIGGTLVMLLSLGQVYAKPLLPPQELAFMGVFLLATACSCSFWTLVAGSTIGGVVFTVAGQFAAGLATAFIVSRIRGQDLQDSEMLPFLIPTGLAYSAVFLWLGRRQFVRLEIRSARFGESALAQSPHRNRVWSRLLMCRPRGKVLNLARKEVRLQKPIFQLAGVFALCWLATCLFQWLRPKQRIDYVFDVLTCVYAPLCSLLAGCVSFGEEKAAGLNTSQLTLPVSLRLQWSVKLAVCAATAALLCLGLPLCFFWITGTVMDLSGSGLMNPHDNGMLSLASISGLVFLLAYWAISMFASTVRAALVAVFGLVALGTCVALGEWLAHNSRLEMGPLVMLMCHLQLTPDTFEEVATHAFPILLCGICGAIMLFSLGQSLALFRYSQASTTKLLAYSLTLAGLVTALTFWLADLVSSIHQLQNSTPVIELRDALTDIAEANADEGREEPRVVSAQELQGRITAQTRTWLRHAAISYAFVHPKRGDHVYQASVLFPSGRVFFVTGHFQDNWGQARPGLVKPAPLPRHRH